MRKYLVRFFGIAALAMGFLMPGSAAHALTVSPPYFDYRLNPGYTVLDVVKVYNEAQEDLTVWAILKNFSADDKEGGAPLFYEPDQDKGGTQLAQWITVSKEPVQIKAGERANITFAVNIPKERAQPGGHFGAIMLSLQPPDVKTGVGIGSQIAALILVNVSGEVREVGSIAEFGFKKTQVWYNHLPVDFFLRFENSGNTHLRPVGNLFIKNWYGRQVASIRLNEDFRSVLPQSIRRFEFTWKNMDNQEGWSGLKNEWQNFGLGRYRAMLVANYGTKNQVLIEEREFSVWPWRLMLIGTGGLAVLILLLWVATKAYNKSIIRKYEKMRNKTGQK